MFFKFVQFIPDAAEIPPTYRQKVEFIKMSLNKMHITIQLKVISKLFKIQPIYYHHIYFLECRNEYNFFKVH